MEQGVTTFHGIGTSTDWIVMVVYFVAIMLFGSYFGRYTRSTSDFFFGGRRFAWWLITADGSVDDHSRLPEVTAILGGMLRKDVDRDPRLSWIEPDLVLEPISEASAR